MSLKTIFNDWFATGAQMDIATRMGIQEFLPNTTAVGF
jgi:hypothetical protein